jgi:hypothetical protein
MPKVTQPPLLELADHFEKFLLMGSRPTGQIIYDYILEFMDRTWGTYSAEEVKGITRFLSEALALSDQKSDAVWNLQHPNR